MPPRDTAAIPAAPRKTLLEWIETDDGDTTSTEPACSEATQAFHAQVVLAREDGAGDLAQRIQPPAGLHLAPLG